MEKQTLDLITPESAHTLHGLFQKRVEKSPGLTAYRYLDNLSNEWSSYSWSESMEKVLSWRKALVAAGLKKGDSISLMLRNCPEWIFLEQACMAQGIISVPLYPNDRPDNIAYIVNESTVKLILIENQNQWKIIKNAQNEFNTQPICISLEDINQSDSEAHLFTADKWLKQSDNNPPPPEEDSIASNDLATIVYTSGTTGKPKGVMLSHWNILSNVYSGSRAVDVYVEDLFLSFLPLSHTLERSIGYYLPMMCGSTVAFARSIPQLAEDLLNIRPTVIVAVPRIYERVYGKIMDQIAHKSPIAKKLFELSIEVGWSRFEASQGRAETSWKNMLWPLLNKLVAKKVLDKLGGRLRFSISGGAPLPEPVSHLFISLGLRILQGYGLTETSPVISVNRFDSDYPASIGKALPGIQVKIGENNELLSKSDSVMLGYWNNEQATKEMFTDDGWIKTGDLARIENDHIFITGRIKEILVLSNGEKVPPVDMEIAICLQPLFEQAMVIGEAKPYLTAVVVMNEENWNEHLKEIDISTTDCESSEVKQYLLKKISSNLKGFPGYAQIRQIYVAKDVWTDENHLLTASLKMRRATLLTHYSNEIDAMYEGHR